MTIEKLVLNYLLHNGVELEEIDNKSDLIELYGLLKEKQFYSNRDVYMNDLIEKMEIHLLKIDGFIYCELNKIIDYFYMIDRNSEIKELIEMIIKEGYSLKEECTNIKTVLLEWYDETQDNDIKEEIERIEYIINML